MSVTASDLLLKFHISLNTGDLPRSIAFYRVLFGLEPAKVRQDYAKFELTEPPLVLSLIPGHPGGNVNHVGLRVRTTEELIDVQRRLEAGGIVTQREDGVECCYARQTKFWVTDPDRLLWEVYVFHEDIEQRGAATVPIVTVEADLTPKPEWTWPHRLGDVFPESIPYESNSLQEVTLEGSLNTTVKTANRANLIPEALRVLRPGGDIRFHGLTSDQSGSDRKLTLPGPASAVEYAPAPVEVVAELAAAGFVDVRITKLSETPCFIVDGVAMRECRIEAKKPGHRPKSKTHQVIYRGPLAEVKDDYGNVFRRGELTLLNVHDWQMLSKGSSASAFVFLSPSETLESACSSPSGGTADQDGRSN